MKKIIITLLALGLILTGLQTAFAGGAINKSNRSTEFMRIFTRAAATDSADIVTYNPAGTVKLEDGFYTNATVQYLIKKDYENNFRDESYASDEPSLIPSLFAAYKQDRWAGFFAFDVPLGGGKVDYADGNFVTYGLAKSIGIQVNQAILTPGSPLYNPTLAGLFAGPLAGPYNTIDHSVEAESMGLGYTLGGAFLINDFVSLSLGVRFLDASMEMSGSAVNSSSVVPVPEITNEIGFTADADGWSGIVGLDIFPNDQVTIGFRYASKTELEYTFDVDKGANILGTLNITDGGKTRDDLPAELNAGLSYQITPALRTEVGFSWFMNTDADLGGTSLREGLEDNIDDSYEIGLGAEFAFSDNFKASFGYLYSSMGVDPEYSSKFLPDLDAHTVGCGLAWDINSNLVLNAALGNVFYKSESYVDNSLVAIGEPNIEVEFEKNVPYFALGIQYQF